MKILLALVLLCACSSSVPDARVAKRVSCQTSALLDALADNQYRVEEVLKSKDTVAALTLMLVDLGRSKAQVVEAVEAFKACTPVVAPIPDAGNKVL